MGRLTTIKNHDLFLETAARLIADDTIPSVRFAVIGDGELRQKLERKAEKLGIARKVVFTGWRRDMGEVYAGLDVLMLTSINEGTPVTIIEAMALGIPVVATAVGGVPDLLGAGTDGSSTVRQRGVMVASGDDAGLAEGLKLVLTDETTTAAVVQRAREFVRREYDAKRLIKDIESLYLAALA